MFLHGGNFMSEISWEVQGHCEEILSKTTVETLIFTY